MPDCFSYRIASTQSDTKILAVTLLRLFLRSVPGIHYILQSSFCQVIASSYMKKEGIHLH